MKNYAQGFIIAAIGVAVGYGIAVWTAEPPEAVVIEREVPFETVIEPDRITDTDLKLLTDSMHPFAEHFWDQVCIGPEQYRAGPLLTNLCVEIDGAFKRNHAALPVLTKLTGNDLVDFVDGVYADEP